MNHKNVPVQYGPPPFPPLPPPLLKSAPTSYPPLLPLLSTRSPHPPISSLSISPSSRISRPSRGSPSTWTPGGGRATGGEPCPCSEAKAEAGSGHHAGERSSGKKASPLSGLCWPPAACFSGLQVLVLELTSSSQVCGGSSSLLPRDLWGTSRTWKDLSYGRITISTLRVSWRSWPAWHQHGHTQSVWSTGTF